jgi:hypothetical protein
MSVVPVHDLTSAKGPRLHCLSKRGLAASSATTETAVQSLDVLQTYRGLVELGKIQYDENQIRVVMQVRALVDAKREESS